MFRSILSYFVLVLIPVVSLAFAVGPYVYLNRKSKVKSSKSKVVLQQAQDDKLDVIASDRKGAWQSPLDATNEIASSKTPRNNNSIQWKHLWLAFSVGLVGNVVWWWITLHLPYNIVKFLNNSDINGALLSIVVVAIFYFLLPFFITKMKAEKFTIKKVIVCSLLSILIGITELVILIFLFIYGWGKASESLHPLPSGYESTIIRLR